MINQQSEARNTSNKKQPKLICQSRTITTACTWPANDYSNGVRDHSNNEARHPPKRLLGEKEHQTRTMRYGTNKCHSLVSSVNTVDFCYELRVAQLDNRRNDYFSLFLCVEKNIWYTRAPCPKICHRQKAYCVIEHRCVWSYSYVATSKYIACTRVQSMSIWLNLYNTTLEAPGTQPLAISAVRIFLGQ